MNQREIKHSENTNQRRHHIALIFFVTSVLLTSIIYSKAHIDSLKTPRELFLLFILGVNALIICRDIYKRQNIQLGRADVVLILLFLYALCRSLMPAQDLYLSLIVELLSPTIFLFASSYTKRLSISASIPIFKVINSLFIIFLFIQTGIGVLQYFNIFRSLNTNFQTTGLFANPGPYAIFLSCLMPIALSEALKNKGKIKKRLCLWFVVLMTLFMIVISQSRTAWIALIISTTYLYGNNKKCLILFIKERLKFHHRVILLIFMALVVVGSSLFLINLKKESAIGRTFIWARTVELIHDNPIWGHGIDNFESEYNEKKSVFFSIESNVEDYKNYATPVSSAFNDYLHLWTEQGLLALLIHLTLVLLVLTGKPKQKNVKTWKTMFLVIVIASFFSYPLQVLSLKVLFFLLAGLISGMCIEKKMFKITNPYTIKLISIAILVASCFLVKYTVSKNRAYQQWKEAFICLKKGNSESVFSSYEALMPALSSDKFFIYNYGSELVLQGNMKDGIPMLEQCIKSINDEDVYLQLGNAYENSQNLSKAMAAYEKANLIAPYLMTPTYRLISLYYSTGREEEAINLAHKLLRFDVKIPSAQIDVMKNDIKEFIEWTNKSH